MKLKIVVIILFAFLTVNYAKSKEKPNIYESFSYFFITNKDGKAVYKEPDINSEKIFVVPYAEQVLSTKMAPMVSFYYIEWKGHKGWTPDDDLSESQPLPTYPENTDEIKKLLTNGYFSASCGISFKLDENGTGGGGYEYCAGGEAPRIKSLTWKGDNPFYVTIVTSTPIGSDSFNAATGYSDSTTTIIIEYNSFNNTFSTNVQKVSFKYDSK